MPSNTDAPVHGQKVLVINDPALIKGELKQVGGSKWDMWNNQLVNQVAASTWLGHADETAKQERIGSAVAGLAGIRPGDEIEAMLAAQMVAAHNASMECYRRAMIQDQTFDARKENLNQANKLSRTQAALTDALNKHRGKGQQKVTVEHVHVHKGGQAIVGAVSTKGGGANADS